jgi:ribosomal protein L11 methyltransferase
MDKPVAGSDHGAAGRSAATIRAQIAVDGGDARRLADQLSEHLGEDAAVAAFEEPDGTWHVAIDFAQPPDEAAVRALVAEARSADAAHALAFERVEQTDWVAQSLAGLRPVRAGRVLVHGAHDRAAVRVNDIGIEIEAALAFGTGHHGTTRGCLLALDHLAKRRRAGDKTFARILDVGTGTGVLAMAAARMFRSHVLASDIDPRAVVVARDNARANRTAPFVTVVEAAGVARRTVRRHAPFDLVFANILLGPLKGLAAPLAHLVAPGGYVVLSGLLAAHAASALASYRAQGLRLERRIPLDGWVTLVLRRP